MIRIALIAGLVAGSACANSSTAKSGHETQGEAKTAKPTPKIVVASRLKAMANAPCEQCHRHVEDPVKSMVKAHSEIRVKHMPDAQCDTCHDPNEPTQLKLASGKAIKLADIHLLCGQCHSTETKDWGLGIHGKQIGNWQTEIHRFSCTRCHDAHQPAFGSMEAVDPPPFPAMGIPKGGH